MIATRTFAIFLEGTDSVEQSSCASAVDAGGLLCLAYVTIYLDWLLWIRMVAWVGTPAPAGWARAPCSQDHGGGGIPPPSMSREKSVVTHRGVAPDRSRSGGKILAAHPVRP